MSLGVAVDGNLRGSKQRIDGCTSGAHNSAVEQCADARRDGRRSLQQARGDCAVFDDDGRLNRYRAPRSPQRARREETGRRDRDQLAVSRCKRSAMRPSIKAWLRSDATSDMVSKVR